MLVHHNYIVEAFLSFLLVGHTHEDIDQLFSVISKYFKSLGKIISPAEFDREAVNALANQPAHFSHIKAVLQWDKALLPHMVKPRPVGICHAHLPTGATPAAAADATATDQMQAGAPAAEMETREPHTFWIHRRQDHKVVMHYKERCAHPVWLPPVRQTSETDPLVTDDEGIVLFATDPPDPMQNPPAEAPLV